MVCIMRLPRIKELVSRILLASGKLYYDLAARKPKNNREDVAIVRIEQLAPLPSGGWPTRWTAIRTPPSSSGCRRSRRTRARGRPSV